MFDRRVRNPPKRAVESLFVPLPPRRGNDQSLGRFRRNIGDQVERRLVRPGRLQEVRRHRSRNAAENQADTMICKPSHTPLSVRTMTSAWDRPFRLGQRRGNHAQERNSRARVDDHFAFVQVLGTCTIKPSQVAGRCVRWPNFVCPGWSQSRTDDRRRQLQPDRLILMDQGVNLPAIRSDTGPRRRCLPWQARRSRSSAGRGSTGAWRQRTYIDGPSGNRLPPTSRRRA